MAVIVPYSRSKILLGDMIAVGGELALVTIKLYVNEFQPGIDSVLADFVEATFDGYAVSTTVVWSPVFRNAIGQAQTVGDSKTFVMSGGEGEIVYGYFAVTAGALVFSEKLANPVAMDHVDAGCVIVPNYTLGSV